MTLSALAFELAYVTLPSLYSPEARGQMHAHVLVPLLETIVLAYEVQIIAANDDSTLHLHLTHNTRQDASTDRNMTGEGAFLIDIRTGDGLKRETKHQIIGSLS